MKPHIYNTPEELPKNIQIIDIFDNSLKELFILENPQFKERWDKKAFGTYITRKNISPNWIHYPWRKLVVKTLPKDLYFRVRTCRNRNIITEKEQKAYHSSSVGIIGMSIGSATLSSLVATGGPGVIHIADDDTIEISNLNRMSASLLDVGKNKVEVAAQRAWEVDPYLNIHLYSKITEANLLAFLLGENRVDIVIDAMDNLSLKVYLRKVCKKHKIPVLMATSNGDNSIIDVERYDLNSTTTIFNGRLEENELIHMSSFTQKEWIEKAVKIADSTLLVERVLESLTQVGSTLSGVPQLSTTVNLSAAAISYIVRNITSGSEVPSGRFIFGLDYIFNNQHE
ncbi:MAG: ThiF family adenylyltransferase [bacterium]|nr:ThiF family adenylyltransferase [bacterium]